MGAFERQIGRNSRFTTQELIVTISTAAGVMFAALVSSESLDDSLVQQDQQRAACIDLETKAEILHDVGDMAAFYGLQHRFDWNTACVPGED
jgi:hypothetical protein